jgi:hypothetical protein
LKLAFRALLPTAVLVAALSFCGVADAAIVTVGPDLTGTYVSEPCSASCALTNTALTQAGAQVLSPVNGTVVRWHVLEGTTVGAYRLRVMNPLGGSYYFFAGSSAWVTSVPTAGVQTFTATVPISAGQAIALEMSPTASIGVGGGLGSFGQWLPAPADGTSSAFGSPGPTEAIGFNAEVQPPPTITSLGTTSGPTGGGTSVVITGTDLEGASAVSFAGTAAAGFTVDSESRVTAVTPADATAGAVPVSVTTPAGTATSTQSFTYVAPSPPAPAPAPVVDHCIVPKLKGKKLRASLVALTIAHCKLGTVKKRGGATEETGRVVKQSRTPGTVLPVGAKVTLTFRPPGSA